MAFFPADKCFTDWQTRIPEDKLTELNSTGLTIAVISGTTQGSHHLFVQTSNGVYIHRLVGEMNDPKVLFASLAFNSEIAMPGTVRVAAINMLLEK